LTEQSPLQASETPEQESAVTALPPVRLDAFEGPLDVLLHLIRSQEMDIFDIPIASLTGQYLEIIKAQREPDLEAAGDYLVMASTLMQLKSRMLLPRPELDAEGEAIDPRAELVAQLLAYEQYRLLAEELDEYPRVGREVYLRAAFPESEGAERPPAEPDLDALLLAFRRVLKRVGGQVRHHVFMDTMSTREQMTVILRRLQRGGVQLDEFLQGQANRETVVTTLLAILELWRQRIITIVQNDCYGPVSLLPKDKAA